MSFLNISFWSISRTFPGSGASRTNDIWSMLICPTLLLATLNLPLHEAANAIIKVLLIFFTSVIQRCRWHLFLEDSAKKQHNRRFSRLVTIWFGQAPQKSLFSFRLLKTEPLCQAWFLTKVPFVCVWKGFCEQDKNHLQDNEPLG